MQPISSVGQCIPTCVKLSSKFVLLQKKEKLLSNKYFTHVVLLSYIHHYSLNIFKVSFVTNNNKKNILLIIKCHVVHKPEIFNLFKYVINKYIIHFNALNFCIPITFLALNLFSQFNSIVDPTYGTGNKRSASSVKYMQQE